MSNNLNNAQSIGMGGISFAGDIEAVIQDDEVNLSKLNIDRFFVRVFDILFSSIGIILLMPVLMVVALLVYMQDGGPIFFGQQRLGENGKRFKCYKFRSMLKNAPELLDKYLKEHPELLDEWKRDHKLKNDPRITAFGQFIRKTSLDEFPQLWNVLKGDMSLVGPRPIVEAEVEKYKKSYRFYSSVRPGITGLWQISGRNNVSYNRRVAMDRVFCKEYSFMLYLYILFATIPAVLLQRGSY